MAPKARHKADSARPASSEAGDAARPQAARTAFDLYCAEHRPRVLQALGLASGSKNTDIAAGPLNQAWVELEPAAKAKYEAVAVVDKHRCIVDRLRRGVRDASLAPKVASTIKAAITALGHASRVARTNRIIEEGIVALEDLDRRLGVETRAALIRYLGTGLASPATHGYAREVFGEILGVRLSALLRRWRDASERLPVAPPDSGEPRPPKRSRKQADAGKIVPLDTSVAEGARDKVRELLLRLVPAKGREIEEELFDATGSGSDIKEYKKCARCLVFNLSAADGMLLRRVCDGEVAPADLVRMRAEDLAPDALKAKRAREREKHFREIHVTEQIPKRRRDLFPRAGRKAEREGEGIPDSQDDAVDQSQGHAQESLEAVEDAAPPAAALEWDIPQQERIATILGSTSGALMSAAQEPPQGVLMDAEPEPAQHDSPDSAPAPGECDPVESRDASRCAAAEVCDSDDNAAVDLFFSSDEEEAEQELSGTRTPTQVPDYYESNFGSQLEDDLRQLVEDDTSGDFALARYLQNQPPTPSSSSSSSSSDEDEASVGRPPGAAAASSSGAAAASSSGAAASSSGAAASSSGAAASSSSGAAASSSGAAASSALPGGGAEGSVRGLEQVVAMGFAADAARDALARAGGSLEGAVALLLE